MTLEDLPTGVVTFLFTDIVGSTALWEAEPQATAEAMVRHDELVASVVASADGRLVRPRGEGDSRFAVFASTRGAIASALGIALALEREPWTTSRPIRVRTAIYTGEADTRAGDYYGDAVNRCARLRSLAHPGQILLSSTAGQMVQGLGLPSGVGLRDLGLHRMKDLSRPEQVYQLTHPDLAAEFAALFSLDRARHNLPIQLSSFVGREHEIRELRKLVQDHRLTTITGFGGMGKTRLALAVAAELADGDGDGVWLIDLSAETDPDRVATAIATILGVAESGDGSAPAVLRWLATKRLLLVLDNLEQILRCASFVAEMLAAAPYVTILATSRAPLQIRGEQEYALAPLDLGAPDTKDDLGSHAAMRLFIDRALEVRHNFSITADTAYAVAAICARLDGHPLSIELAAARMRVLDPHVLLRRLDTALSVLGGGPGDRPERHQTVRATIEWSYQLLGAAERRLLACLSIFPGTMSFDAIEAICAPVVAELDVLEGMSSLVQNSLLRALEPERRHEQRYVLLVPIREFAAERLAVEQLDGEMAQRHAAFYRSIQAAVPDQSPEEYDRQCESVTTDMHNIRAALAYYQMRGTPADEADFVDGTFANELVYEFRLGEASQLIERVIERADRPTRATAMAHYNLIFVRSWSGRLEEARQEAIAAMEHAKAAGCPAVAAIAAVAGIRQARHRAEFTHMVEIAGAAVEQMPETGNWPARWNAEGWFKTEMACNLGYVDYERALAAARSLVTLAPSDFDVVSDVAALVELLCLTGQYTAADEQVAAYAQRERTADWDLGYFRLVLARCRVRLGSGDIDEALRLGREALRLCEQVDVTIMVVRALRTVADVLFAAGDLTGAIDALQRAAIALADSDDDMARGAVEWRLARVLRKAGSDDGEVLTRAWTHLAGNDWKALPEVLGCMLERAVACADHDPDRAAQMLGLVQTHRGQYVLPMGVADEISALMTELRGKLGAPTLDSILTAASAEPLPDRP